MIGESDRSRSNGFNNSRSVIAPEFNVSTWLNRESDLSLTQLKGKVVVVYVFQMLCPGCVALSLPQAKALHHAFARENLQIIGLHSVFEHHQANSEATLRAFLLENRVDFPVAIDAPATQSAIPLTMSEYGLPGTPSLLLIDKFGYLRANHFGHQHDILVTKQVSELLLCD